MAKTSQVTVSIVETGDGTTLNKAFTDAQNLNTAPPGSLTTANGFTAIPIPPGFTIQSLTINPPAGSTVTKTLKGVTGDTGIVLQTASATKLPIGGGAVLGLACNGIEVVELVWG
jgi:hypothetical protein